MDAETAKYHRASVKTSQMTEESVDHRSAALRWGRRSREDDVRLGCDDRRQNRSVTESSGRRGPHVPQRTPSVFGGRRDDTTADTRARAFVSSPERPRPRLRERTQSWGNAAQDGISNDRLAEILQMLARKEENAEQESSSSVTPTNRLNDTTPVNPNEVLSSSTDSSVEEIDQRTPGIVCEETIGVELRDTPSMSEQSEGLRRSITGALDWTMHAITAAANRMYHPEVLSEAHHEGERSAVDALEDLFLWRDVWRSGRACFGGMYMIICIKVYLDTGIQIVQPSTAVASIALCVLMYNSLLKRYSSRAGAPQNMHTEALFLDKLARGIISFGHEAASTVPPFIALTARNLSGANGPKSFYLGMVLWIFMLIGELRVLSQLGMLLVMFTSLFVLPMLYIESKWVLDSLAIAGCKVILSGFRVEKRKELGLAIGLGIAISWILDLGFVVRVSLGVLGTALVLVWRMNID